MDWQEVCESPYLKGLPFKFELNGYGQIVATPLKSSHSVLKGKITYKLNELAKESDKVFPNCPIETEDNVKVVDVAWISQKRYQKVKHEVVYSIAPEICIELVSLSNSQQEMNDKKALYFQAGTQEVWFCSEEGQIEFYTEDGKLEKSVLVPEFPSFIES